MDVGSLCIHWSVQNENMLFVVTNRKHVVDEND